MPQDTDPTKTYKWRYVKHFLKRVDEWNITDDFAFKIIDAIVTYAKQNKQTRKGLSLLASDQILDKVFDIVQEGQKSEKSLASKLQRESELIHSTNLLESKHAKGMPMIVKLFLQNKISITILAYSKICQNTMMKLSKVDRQMLPSGKQLILTRMNTNNNPSLKSSIRSVLGSDWNKM